MSALQRIVLVMGLLTVAAMGAFPPWVIAPVKHPSATTSAGYHFILRPPSTKYDPWLDAFDRRFSGLKEAGSGPRFARIDYSRLLVQWTVVLGLFGVAFVAAPRNVRDRNDLETSMNWMRGFTRAYLVLWFLWAAVCVQRGIMSHLHYTGAERGSGFDSAGVYVEPQLELGSMMGVLTVAFVLPGGILLGARWIVSGFRGPRGS